MHCPGRFALPFTAAECFVTAKSSRWKRGSGTENAKHPSGRSGFRYLTPFSRPTLNRRRDKARDQTCPRAESRLQAETPTG
jgi:hypothetical protein